MVGVAINIIWSKVMRMHISLTICHFLGRAAARAPISGFVILSVGLSQLASGEVLRVAIGFKDV